MDVLTIGQVAKQAKIGIETIRFYERQGLIEEPPRRESGYRQYPQEVIDRLAFIRRAKDLGFSLKEIADLLALTKQRNSNAGNVKERVIQKISEVEAKIDHLQKIKKSLKKLSDSCPGKGPLKNCPIISSLSGRENKKRTKKKGKKV